MSLLMGVFKKYVRWGEEGGGPWKANKYEQEGVLACMYVDFQNEVL